ncbi:thiol S-methyltransferase TMT1A-like [Ambystoma mexicanum]|uniref:thiol S-methyltransferase TMT1A-like n=1 Tax=Ambystoma mexicanum TaxID=8296 RepID=UPI0037E7E4D9
MSFVIGSLQVCIALLALPVYILDILGAWEPVAKKVLPYVLDRFTTYYNNKMHSYKKALFSNMLDFAGPGGRLNLLEIGCGTGANFQFFPRGSHVTCMDPNPDFKRFLSKSVAENKHVRFESFVVASGEDMSGVTSSSIDVVVCTLVMCSVHSVEVVLKEVRRVLRPGGAFFFLEHVNADKSSWTYFFQQIYHPTWKRVFGGCHLIRETWKDIEKARFSELKLQHIWAPLKWNPGRTHIMGYAVK